MCHRLINFTTCVSPFDKFRVTVTTTFQSGLPVFCASIGIVNQQKEVVVAVVYNPLLDEMVTAIKGQGCLVNGRKLATESGTNKAPIELQNSIVNIGFPVCKVETLMASSRAVTALSTKVKGSRMFACASQVVFRARANFRAKVARSGMPYLACHRAKT